MERRSRSFRSFEFDSNYEFYSTLAMGRGLRSRFYLFLNEPSTQATSQEKKN